MIIVNTQDPAAAGVFTVDFQVYLASNPNVMTYFPVHFILESACTVSSINYDLAQSELANVILYEIG